MRQNLSDARSANAGIYTILGVCSTSSAVVNYVNQATQRLLYAMKSVGTYGRFRITTNGNESNSIITWPRHIEAIESVAVNQFPSVIRNGWFEFVENGPGVMDSTSGIGNQLVDAADAYTTSDIITTGNPKKIKCIPVLAEATGIYITIYGEDANGNLVITNQAGSILRGERISINGSGQTTNTFSKITGITKGATNGVVKLYEVDTVTLVERLIATYEPDETRPVYRRSIIPGLQNNGACVACGGVDGDPPQVDVVGKLRYIPVVNDTDWLLIGNLPALKLEIMAIRKEENDLLNEAMGYHAKAIALLQEELNHWQGDGSVPAFRAEDNAIFGGGGVESLV